MYLMFEALGHVSDRELMLVNLDLLDTFDAKSVSGARAQFHLVQPYSWHEICDDRDSAGAKEKSAFE